MLIEKLGDRLEDLYAWAAMYAPQWLIKGITALIVVDLIVWAFSW